MKSYGANLTSVLTLALAMILSPQGLSAQNQKKTSTTPQSSQSAVRATTTAASAQTNSNTIVLPVLGSGTTNFIPLWTGRQVIGNSILSQVPGGLNVAGAMTATSFFGDGSHLVNVNALTLQGLSPSAFVQTTGSNTFTGNQTITGNLTLTGFLNNALTLQGGLTDGNGQEGANILGGFTGDPATGASGNIISPGVIGATIAGGGGSYDSSILPQRPQIGSSTQLTTKQRLHSRLKLHNPSSSGVESAQVQSATAPPATGIQVGPNLVQPAANWSTIGGGLKNTAGGFASTVAGGFGNTSSGNYSTIAGGDVNEATGSESVVGGGTFNSAQGDDSTVSGGLQNTAAGLLSTVSGGGFDPHLSVVVVGPNQALGEGDTVAGGISNTANSSNSSSSCDYGPIVPCGATVGGGIANAALGTTSTVSGGTFNSAIGYDSMIPGGDGNQALGSQSFAAGINAAANYDHSFVWSDGNVGQDTGPNQFVASASGGFFFYTGGFPSTGATLPSGSGSWNSMSDRNVKENFSDVDGKALLAKLATIPIFTWNYKAQAKSIRHMGPTAQDFREAFNLGEDEKHISTVDAQGVALAAIQELYKLSREKNESLEQQLQQVKQAEDAQIAELSRKLEEKLRTVNLLEERLSRIESSLLRTASSSDTQPQMTVLRAEPTQGQ